eukprot:GHVU01204746.1.p1 GENE.GHVU01204746.1~~GHVU01204746.1.p1  ORF type:complete len:115 (-),score=8.15 GHVU01204746.1:61-405(-)
MSSTAWPASPAGMEEIDSALPSPTPAFRRLRLPPSVVCAQLALPSECIRTAPMIMNARAPIHRDLPASASAFTLPPSIHPSASRPPSTTAESFDYRMYELSYIRTTTDLRCNVR